MKFDKQCHKYFTDGTTCSDLNTDSNFHWQHTLNVSPAKCLGTRIVLSLMKTKNLKWVYSVYFHSFM
jgi:hypothetical protein